MSCAAKTDPIATCRFELGIDDAVLAALGRFVVLGGYVEMLLTRLLAHLCGAEPSAMLSVAADLEGKALAAAAARLVRLKLPPTVHEPVLELLAEADLLCRERDLLIRGQWDQGPAPKTATVLTPHPARAELAHAVTLGAAELADLQEHAEHIVRGLTRLCLELGVGF